MKPPAVDTWFTISEWGYDRRTDAVVRSTERLRRASDRPGKSDKVWDWVVGRKGLRDALGTAQNQSGARAAIRKVVRGLPSKEGWPGAGVE